MKELITKHSWRIRLDKTAPVLGQIAIINKAKQYSFVSTPGRRDFNTLEVTTILTHLKEINND